MEWFLICSAALYLIYKFLIVPQLYWKRRNVPQDFPVPILGDSLWMVLGNQSLSEFSSSMYLKCSNSRYYGIYRMTTPSLLIRDPDLIKRITIRDFDYFVDHVEFFPSGNDPILDNNLFSAKGQHWRHLRTTLTPVFTGHKIRAQFDLAKECAERFVQFHLNKKEELITIDAKDCFGRYTSDVIASLAFGIESDSLTNPNNEFYSSGVDILSATGFITSMKYVLAYFCPTILKLSGFKVFSGKSSNFLKTVVSETIAHREKHNVVRPDMIQVMIGARKGATEIEETMSSVQEDCMTNIKVSDTAKNRPITDEDITSQAFVFFFAGFETNSTLMSLMAYELALHPHIQSKLKEEILKVNNDFNGILSYEMLNSMKYLDMVVQEALRKNPPARYMDRVCTKPYTIEPIHPGEKPVHLEVGDNIFIPITAIHADGSIYDNPELFNPERFSPENIKNLKPYTYIPFGVGPRHCIGYRFSIMTTKVVFFYLLKQFDIIVVDKTNIPLKLGKSLINLNVDGGVWLGLRYSDNVSD